jgi:hypothetical protein
VLTLGLVFVEIVDGRVVVSDSALDDLEAAGLLSSQVSHASLDAADIAFEGDFTCLGELFFTVAGVAC